MQDEYDEGGGDEDHGHGDDQEGTASDDRESGDDWRLEADLQSCSLLDASTLWPRQAWCFYGETMTCCASAPSSSILR